ncbi:hypothetical protein ABEB36_006251 [Hypothenemus hampei]|uniref:Uncharacterized protein n=1 Tax=Hypothenemus hampei TaxID=57062 RepID=A0ABD1EPV5_HYPHA
MPRRKKHSKNGKHKQKKQQLQVQKTNKNNESGENDSISTPMKPSNSKKDSFEMETPVKWSSNKQAYSLIDTTPVNKSRSLNGKTSNLGSTLNVTNLNYLFNVNSNDWNDIKETVKLKRSKSSIAKLHSPGSEKPLSYRNTQTIMNLEDLFEKSQQHSIVETPKIAQKILYDTDNCKSFYSPSLNNKKLNNEVNFNPYVKEKELRTMDIQVQKFKGQSVGEMSFFTSQLFDQKINSTPISAQQLKDQLAKEELDRLSNCTSSDTPKQNIINNMQSPSIFEHTVTRRENININTPPVAEKVLNKDQTNSIHLLGSKRKTPSRRSPKLNKLVGHSRMFNRNLSYTRLSQSQRSSLENSCEMIHSPAVRIGVYEKMLNRIQKYSKASAKWSMRLMESCSQLGLQIKNSLASMCNVQSNRSIEEWTPKFCKCEEYKMEINNLNVKILQLNEELKQLTQQLNTHCEDIGQLKEIQKIKAELATYKDLRQEIVILKEQFACFKNQTVSKTSVLAPAPPPPPPPPPPPLPLATTHVPVKLHLNHKSRSLLDTKSLNNDSRPIISLDEILKVKLKKTSDRPLSTPSKRPRAVSTPVVDDLFRQVKLRRSSFMANATPISAGNLLTPGGMSTGSSEMSSTSPASSLNRLLDNGGSVWPVKRLRKPGGLRFHSVHRKSPRASPGFRRERGGS